MKLGKFLLLMVLSLGTVFANEGVMIMKMKDMRDAMHDINDGFFFNNKVGILKGIDKLKEANEIFATMEDVKKYLPAKIKHMSGISYNNARKISMNLDNMKNYINAGKFSQAASSYTDIVNSCTACHAIVRGW